MNEKQPIESVTQNNPVRESNNETHTCLFCGTNFVSKNDLELHSHLHNKNKSFICLLCKEVFPDLKLLKLHDLRHSLEEAHEDMSGIENLFTPLALSPCRVCGEGFPCDEELVEHYVNNHKTYGNASNGFMGVISKDDLSSDSCDSSGEEQIHYPLLREEIVTKNGIMHVRFTLIDHPNVQVGEFVRMVEHKISTKKRNLKSNVQPKKVRKFLGDKIYTNKSQVKSSSAPKQSHKVAKPLIKNRKTLSQHRRIELQNKTKISKLEPNRMSTDAKTKNKLENEVLEVSSDSDVEIIFENHEKKVNVKRPRHSKILAMRKKIWKNNPSTFVPPKACQTCQRLFVSVEEYQRHLLSHKKYNCRKCYQVFRSADLLHEHTSLHHVQPKRNSYQCETCEKEFDSFIEWKNHRKSHILSQLHCSRCGAKVKNAKNLKTHRCRKNKCVICLYQFPRMYNLKRHLKTVHKLGEMEIEQLSEAPTINTKDEPILTENDQEIKLSKQETEVLPEIENKFTESTIEIKSAPLNEEKIISLPSDFSSTSNGKEEDVESSLEKKKFPVKNKNLVNVAPSKLVKKSINNKKESERKKVILKNKVSQSFKKTVSKKIVQNPSSSKQIQKKQSNFKKTVANSNKQNKTSTKTSTSKESIKNSYSSKKIPTKLSLLKKQFNKTKVSVPYRSKGNVKPSFRKLLIDKEKKKTVIDSKRSSSRSKTFTTTLQKNKLKPKKIR